jgi:hypothetical protein
MGIEEGEKVQAKGMSNIFNKIITENIPNLEKSRRIPRWQLDGGTRNCASYSEILERRWRNTLQAKPPRRAKL